MDIDPDEVYAVTKTAVVFDSIEAGLPIPLEKAPSVHFGRLLPHTGGRTGHISYFVRSRGIKYQTSAHGNYKGIVEPEEIEVSGAYYSAITYDRDLPPTWDFGK
jgi:hypothetical protein